MPWDVHPGSLIMRMRNGLQSSFSFSLGKKLSNYQTKILKCLPSGRIVLQGSASSPSTQCRIHPKVLRSCFWKCFLSLHITLGWMIFTWVMSKFTAAFYNCKFCSTELKLDYSDNKILSLKDLLTMIRMEENLLFLLIGRTWAILLPWQIFQIWIIYLV